MAESVQVKVEETPADKPAAVAPQPGEFLEVKERPEWCPEKFYQDGKVNMKALATSYGELEKSKSAEKPPEQQQAAKEENQTPPIVVPGVAPEAMTKFTEEMTKDGKLSDTSYADLAKAGYPKEIVDVYLKGLGADAAVEQGVLAAAENDRIIKSVGGAEKFEQMTNWAASNMSAKELQEYNDSVSSGNVARAELAIRGMQQKYVQANGQDLNFLDSESADGSGYKPYGSTYELTQDINSEAYKKDEGFRKKVEQRIKVSSIL